MAPRQHIGVLGGMFDPVHNGHLHMAVAVREALGLAEMRLLPCSRPAHRGAACASDRQRIMMLERAIEGVPGLHVDDRECRREDVSYLYDTMLSLRAELPEAALYFVLGSDSFLGLEGWHRWEDLLELCHWVVVPRPGSRLAPEGRLADHLAQRRLGSIEELKKRSGGAIWVAEPSPLELSSTLIRERLANARTLHFLTPEPVIDFITQHHLYT